MQFNKKKHGYGVKCKINLFNLQQAYLLASPDTHQYLTAPQVPHRIAHQLTRY